MTKENRRPTPKDEKLDQDFISTITVAEGSYRLYLPHKETDYIQGKIAASLEPYELPMLQDIQSRVKPKDYVFDVGANIGNHTLYLAAVAKCNLFSFEPNKDLCDSLHHSLELNQLSKKVRVHQVGVGAKSGVGKFDYLDKSNLGAQSITSDLESPSEAQFEVIALDALERNFQVRVLKIDVEGMELAVLEGAKELIATDMPLVYVECISETHFAEIHKWVTQRGYVYWDTFNATPTHLFIHASQVSPTQQIERMLYKAVRGEYKSINEISRLQKNLDAANAKYRTSNLNLATLKEKLEAANAKNQDLTNYIALQEQAAATRNALNDEHHFEFERKILALEELLEAECDTTKQLEEKLSLLHKDLGRVENQRIAAEKCIQEIRSSLTFRVVHQFRNAGSLRGLLRLPVTLWDIYNLVKSRNKQDKKIANPTGEEVSDKSSDSQQDRWSSEETSQERKRNSPRSQPIPNVTAHDPKHRLYTSDLTVACILDEFTAEALSHEVKLIKVTQETWQSQIEADPPHFLLVESCWRGNDGNWGALTKGSGGGKKLSGLLRYCKQQGIPTVFWNKEDPPHYDKFGPLARLFDLAVTTDVNMVPRYKEDFGIDVHPLSFGAQPKVHNPEPAIHRMQKAVFAGSYYRDKPKRCNDFNDVMEQLVLAGVECDIFDRNYHRGIEKFAFPDNYQTRIVGNLLPEEVWRAHKGYKYQVNMNSVQDSATMFARRVYESLASGTPVISNESVGVRQLFGDVVIMPGKQSISEQLSLLEADPQAYQALAYRGVRAVMREHTYGHRVQELCLLLGMDVEVAIPKCTLVITASSAADIQRAKQLFDAQTAQNKHLFIELKNFDTAHHFLNNSNDTVTYAMQLAREFYEDGRHYYGNYRVLHHDVTHPLPAEALEDFLYWGTWESSSDQSQAARRAEVSE